ncbi:MAG: GNAT family N-acetyltransferase [Bacteroidota bacterium]
MVRKAAIEKTDSISHHSLLPLQDGFSVRFYFDFRQIPSIWDRLAPSGDLFLQRDYLSVLQEFAPAEMKFCYAIFYHHANTASAPAQPVGIALFQEQYFQADRSIAGEKPRYCFFHAVANTFRKVLARSVAFHTLVCGNLLLTGSHGFYFDESRVQPKLAFKLIGAAMKQACALLEKEGRPISVLLLKDFSDETRNAARQLDELKYNEFTIQPNMVLPLRESWNSFDDYLNDFSSKYRVRARRAFKKAKGIVKMELDAQQIEARIDTIYALYDQVVENANFNVVKLHKNYFLGLKRALGDRFRLTGYFLEDRLIGFYTTIDNHRELEAHFLGIDQRFNQPKQVYLNMLYDMVREGIEGHFQRVIFARTAMEIKSSVGAIPEELYCYMRHKNHLSNKFAGTIFEYLRPPQEWVQRRPFRDS